MMIFGIFWYLLLINLVVSLFLEDSLIFNAFSFGFRVGDTNWYNLMLSDIIYRLTIDDKICLMERFIYKQG